MRGPCVQRLVGPLRQTGRHKSTKLRSEARGAPRAEPRARPCGRRSHFPDGRVSGCGRDLDRGYGSSVLLPRVGALEIFGKINSYPSTNSHASAKGPFPTALREISGLSPWHMVPMCGTQALATKLGKNCGRVNLADFWSLN